MRWAQPRVDGDRGRGVEAQGVRGLSGAGRWVGEVPEEA